MKKILNKCNSKEEIIEQSDLIKNHSNLDFFKIAEIKHKNFFFQKLLLTKIKNNWNKIIFFLFFLNYYLYVLSLEKC